MLNTDFGFFSPGLICAWADFDVGLILWSASENLDFQMRTGIDKLMSDYPFNFCFFFKHVIQSSLFSLSSASLLLLLLLFISFYYYHCTIPMVIILLGLLILLFHCWCYVIENGKWNLKSFLCLAFSNDMIVNNILYPLVINSSSSMTNRILPVG